ncbi:MAG: flagellar basal body P-ring formation chaperone FlgA [Opitutae bacterium]|nr:flagellar basal body P-ring formation chaperone FlgA [Opitutae bacterium]
MRASFLLILVLTVTALRAAPAVDAAVGATPLSRDQFVALLTENLVSHFNLEGELQLELLRAWAAPARVAAQWSVEIAEYPALPAAAMLTRCRLLADGQVVGEYTATLRASLWRDAWAARQPLAANTSFDATSLETRRVDFLRDREALPASVGDQSYLFVRSIQPNRLLTWRDISRRPLVRKGDLIEVAAIDGKLQIIMRGLAMENGAAGDTVTVRNPESKRNFAAQVIAENRVQIRF